MHSRVVDGGTAASYSSNTIAWTADWIDCSDAVSVKFRVRGIVHDHTASWGWSNTIDVRFTDGQNSAIVHVYCLGEGCNFNDYCDILPGADGSNWYVYNVAIPATINRTHMKIGIQNHAHCWSWYGWFSDLKFYLDMVELFMCGDANSDGVVGPGDVVFLLNYLYRSGDPPCPMAAGDANGDGVVGPGDVVYLLNYLYRGGPAPCPPIPGGSPANTAKLSTHGHAQISLLLETKPNSSNLEEVTEISVVGKFDRDVAMVHLEIEFDPDEVVLLDPALTPVTENLQLFTGIDAGIQKMGMVDLTCEEYLTAGEGELVKLRARGETLSSIRIKNAVLVGRDAVRLNVDISSEFKLKESTPQHFSLSQNYPNPFNPQTTISYALPQNAHVKLVVYNLLGQKVKTLVDEHQSAGHKTVWWDGKDESGAPVASSVYFYRIDADEFFEVKKMLLVK